MKLDTHWTRHDIELAGTKRIAYCRSDLQDAAYDKFIEEHFRGVHSEGGIIFRRLGPTPPMVKVAHPGGLVGHKLTAPPKVEVWFLPKCSFECSLGLLEHFSFPGPGISKNPQGARARAAQIVRRLATGREITLVTISSEVATFYHVGDGPPLRPSELDSLFDFNQTEFGMDYQEPEYKGLKTHYCRAGFFELGRI
jgi:hypothetical protein